MNEIKVEEHCKKSVIKLKAKEDYLPSSWNISNFIDNFASSYYKIDTLNTLSKRLCQGEKPKNVFILDNSFQLNRSYSSLNTIKLNDDSIAQLYTIGCPVSLFPNKKILILNHFFKLFRKCNELLYSYRISRINHKKIKIYTTKIFYKDLEYDKITDLFFTNEIIKKINRNEKQYDAIVNGLRKLTSDSLREYISHIENFYNFEFIETKLKKINSLKEDDFLKNNNELIRKYYDPFYYYVSKLSRPMICIYDDITHQIEIIGLEHINIKKRNYNFFDLKSVTHNSPPVYQIITGTASLVCTLFETVKKEKRAKELHIEKIKQEKIKTEILENLKEELNNIDKLLDYIKENKIEEIDKIEDEYIRDNLNLIYKKSQNRTKSIFYTNKLQIVEMDEFKSNFDVLA